MITPNTNIILLDVPLTLDSKNQLRFISREAQTNYFLSLPHIIEENATYQRKDGVVRFPAKVDDIRHFNYCMYQNENYSNKWFYAFITGMRYINDGMTAISISTDTWQTWQFDLKFYPSFIEREMIDPAQDVPRCKFSSRTF